MEYGTPDYYGFIGLAFFLGLIYRMDNLKMSFIGSVTLIILAYTSGCSPENTTQTIEKEEGYKIGSSISVLAKFTSINIETKLLVTKYPTQYDYERIGNSKIFIVINNWEDIESQLKKAFSYSSEPPPPTEKKPYYYIMRIYIKEKYLAEYPEFDTYTVEITDISRVEKSKIWDRSDYKYK